MNTKIIPLDEQKRQLDILLHFLKHGTPIACTEENVKLLKQISDTLDEVHRAMSSTEYLKSLVV